MPKLSVIVNDRNEYFSHWAARFSPQWDGDDETFVTVPVFTKHYPQSYTYRTKQAAKRAKERMWGKLAVITLTVEEDHDSVDWKYDYCRLHDCMFKSTEEQPYCPNRNLPDPEPGRKQYRPLNCIPDVETVTEIMEV
jgi:hypothetical protein